MIDPLDDRDFHTTAVGIPAQVVIDRIPGGLTAGANQVETSGESAGLVSFQHSDKVHPRRGFFGGFSGALGGERRVTQQA
jgi:hypothetical protein